MYASTCQGKKVPGVAGAGARYAMKKIKSSKNGWVGIDESDAKLANQDIDDDLSHSLDRIHLQKYRTMIERSYDTRGIRRQHTDLSIQRDIALKLDLDSALSRPPRSKLERPGSSLADSGRTAGGRRHRTETPTNGRQKKRRNATAAAPNREHLLRSRSTASFSDKSKSNENRERTLSVDSELSEISKSGSSETSTSTETDNVSVITAGTQPRLLRRNRPSTVSGDRILERANGHTSDPYYGKSPYTLTTSTYSLSGAAFSPTPARRRPRPKTAVPPSRATRNSRAEAQSLRLLKSKTHIDELLGSEIEARRKALEEQRKTLKEETERKLREKVENFCQRLDEFKKQQKDEANMFRPSVRQFSFANF
ncbi:uncharacterized protein [Branchiostoma lanceolatum]|uniref:uncharacterized protein isoform X1 n=1 Tax=Branchiostoma lanceolatum TaxID=7740 RepID=UPI003454D6DE